jgi:hypothetical protein
MTGKSNRKVMRTEVPHIFSNRIVKPNRNMPLKTYQKKTQGNLTQRFIDSDKDGVVNGIDCYGFNPKRHGALNDVDELDQEYEQSIKQQYETEELEPYGNQIEHKSGNVPAVVEDSGVPMKHRTKFHDNSNHYKHEKSETDGEEATEDIVDAEYSESKNPPANYYGQSEKKQSFWERNFSKEGINQARKNIYDRELELATVRGLSNEAINKFNGLQKLPYNMRVHELRKSMGKLKKHQHLVERAKQAEITSKLSLATYRGKMGYAGKPQPRKNPLYRNPGNMAHIIGGQIQGGFLESTSYTKEVQNSGAGINKQISMRDKLKDFFI